MSKSAKSIERRKVASTGQLWLRLPGLVREALYETVIGAAWRVWMKHWKRSVWRRVARATSIAVDRKALRAGHARSSLVLGGRRVAVNRPRGRSVEGRQLGLPSWRDRNARDPLDERA